MLTNLSPSDRATLSLSYGDYLRFSQLMQERFGLNFPERRRMELEIGVRRAFAASTSPDLEHFYQSLLDPNQGPLELERLANHLTVGETYFFRDSGQFDALIKHVLPEIIERRRAVRTLRVWSAGCASGEEPYSIAMLLRDLLPDLEHWSITILATDINTQNLERAHRGRYTEWAFRESRARDLRTRFFKPHGNLYELSSEIRRMVTFRQLNLAESSYPSYETNTMFMDLILCRNVTIYFPETVTRQVVDRFYNSLVDGGWLVIGHSEHSLNTYQRFLTRNYPDAILYQRPTETQKPPPAPVFTLPVKLAPLAVVKPAAVEKPLPPPPPPVIPPTVGHSSSEFEQAQTLLTHGHVDQGRDLLLRWLITHPNDPAACSLLGKAYANLGNWPEAERWCNIAMAADKLNLEAYYTLALVYQHQGQRNRAIEMMKRVVYIDRNDILGHFSLADLYHSSGQTAQALKSLENARRLLETRGMDALIPRSDDITVGRLAQTVLEMQQIWESEAGQSAPPAPGSENPQTE